MIQTATQLKALIRNRAKGDSDKAQILLRVYMMERLLERISVSEFKDSFILKGGMLVASLVGIDTRATVDVDTSVRALPLTIENAENFMKEIMAIDLGDGVRFRITRTMEIMEGREYEGIRFFVESKIDRLRQTIKIDISTGDEVTPEAVRYDFPLLLEDRKIPLWSYNLETLLAEKFETIMTRADANTRMRDFYDIYILMELYKSEIDAVTMRQAFIATCRHRKSEAGIERLEDILATVKDSEAMQNNWKQYIDSNSYVGNLSWEQVMSGVYSLKEIVVK